MTSQRRWLAFVLLAGPALAGTAEPATLRRHVILPGAVRVNGEGQTLVVEWLPATGREPARVTEVRLGQADTLPRSAARLTVDDERVRGEIAAPAEKLRPKGTWRFEGPIGTGDTLGTWSGEQAGEKNSGSARLILTYDAGPGGGMAIRAWVPAGPAPVRGVFYWGNGGRNDARPEVVRDRWLAFCRLHRFALIATSAYGSDMGGSDGRILREQVAAIAAASGRAELDQVPVIFSGHSNGGIKAWEFNAAHPGRVIAFTVSKAARIDLPMPDDIGRRNPAILVAGQDDEPDYGRAIRFHFARNRTRQAPWAFIVEPRMGHSVGRAPHVWLPFFDWAVRSRLAGPGAPLRPVDASAGWVIVQRPLKAGERPFGPAAENQVPLDDTSWHATEPLVFAHLGLVAPADAPTLTVEGGRGAFTVGERVRLLVADFGRKETSEVHLTINGQPAGSVTRAAPALTLTFQQPGVYVASAFTQNPSRIGGPVAWVVEAAP